MTKLPMARAKILVVISATARLKFCCRRFSPPKKKLFPMTSSRVQRMLPSKDVLTITISSLNKAISDTISSTAFLESSSVS